jgi:hypothetical protein
MTNLSIQAARAMRAAGRIAEARNAPQRKMLTQPGSRS